MSRTGKFAQGKESLRNSNQTPSRGKRSVLEKVEDVRRERREEEVEGNWSGSQSVHGMEGPRMTG
jgi:hypothetical protein